MDVRLLPVGNDNEWTWRLRDDDSNVITLAGARFASVEEARRGASAVLDSRHPPDSPDPIVA
jgi:hypothetical protein